MKEIGVFGGTFNPIHWGHLLIAEFAREHFQLDKVLFITCARPPHRKDVDLDAEERFEMVQAAVAGNDKFEASRIELDRPGPSYMIDTLQEVQKLYGLDTRINLIVGGDNIAQLKLWHKANEIFKTCRILVAPRVESYSHLLEDLSDGGAGKKIVAPAEIELIRCPLVQISSSQIRSRIHNGKTVRYMVPPAVYDILHAHGYYKLTDSSKETIAAEI